MEENFVQCKKKKLLKSRIRQVQPSSPLVTGEFNFETDQQEEQEEDEDYKIKQLEKEIEKLKKRKD
jgi:hypothetical protein